MELKYLQMGNNREMQHHIYMVEDNSGLLGKRGLEAVEAAPVLLTLTPAICLEAGLDHILGIGQHPGEDASQASSRQHASSALSQLSGLTKSILLLMD